MKTISTILPVYDSLSKQDYQRTRNALPVHCPRWRLPAMQWNVEADDPGVLCSIRLVDMVGTETELLLNWFQVGIRQANLTWAAMTNAGYDTFASADGYSFTITKTTAPDVDYVFSDDFAVTDGEAYLIYVNTQLYVSGTLPQVYIVDNAGNIISEVVRVGSGIPYPGFTDIFTYALRVTATDANARVRFRNNATELANFNLTWFIWEINAPTLYSAITDEYFEYKGDPVGGSGSAPARAFLPIGIYYLKMTTVNNYVYYSDWFEVTCVYPNLIATWYNSGGSPYETFTSTGVQITSAIETGADGRAYSTEIFELINGESVRIIFFLTLNAGALPRLELYNTDTDSYYTETEVTIVGLNDITFTSTRDGNYRIRFRSSAAANFSTSDVLAMREYSEKYLTINFFNVCDLGDILYADGLTQTIWFESDTMEQSFPLDEQDQKNGEARLVRSFARGDKKYLARTKEVPDFLVQVFHRMRLHDSIEMTDLVGDVNDMYNIEVEHEWLGDDKYYAKIEIMFDYNEAWVVAGCCNNFE